MLFEIFGGFSFCKVALARGAVKETEGREEAEGMWLMKADEEDEEEEDDDDDECPLRLRIAETSLWRFFSRLAASVGVVKPPVSKRTSWGMERGEMIAAAVEFLEGR